jgi:TP901-1 family phage major tail protein
MHWVRQAYFSGDATTMHLAIPGFGVMQGQCVVSELSYGGEHDGEAMFSVRLASAGAISFEAV